MKKIKVVSKGYTITINSRQGLNGLATRTKRTFSTKTTTKAIKELLILLESSYNGSAEIITCDEETRKEIILEFMKNYGKKIYKDFKYSSEPDEEEKTITLFEDLVNGLLGYTTDWNIPFKSVIDYEITYSSRDVYKKEINL